jgi:hypothetical protein
MLENTHIIKPGINPSAYLTKIGIAGQDQGSYPGYYSIRGYAFEFSDGTEIVTNSSYNPYRLSIDIPPNNAIYAKWLSMPGGCDKIDIQYKKRNCVLTVEIITTYKNNNIVGKFKTDYSPGYGSFGRVNEIYTVPKNHLVGSLICDFHPCPNYGGQDLYVDAVQSVPTPVIYPPINGGWAPWEVWPNTCTTGTLTTKRTCTQPPPSNGGETCIGSDTRTKSCIIDAGWGAWSAWSACNNGHNTRERLCNNPPKLPDGLPCSGDSVQIGTCDGGGIVDEGVVDGIDDGFDDEVVDDGIDDEVDDEVIDDGIDDGIDDEVDDEVIDDGIDDEVDDGVIDDEVDDEVVDGGDDEEDNSKILYIGIGIGIVVFILLVIIGVYKSIPDSDS